MKFFVNDTQGDGASSFVDVVNHLSYCCLVQLNYDNSIFVLMLGGNEVARGSGNYGKHITKSIGNCTPS